MFIVADYASLTYVLGAQKNRLIEMVLLSTHNIGFGWETINLFFVTHSYMLTKGLIYSSVFFMEPNKWIWTLIRIHIVCNLYKYCKNMSRRQKL